MGECPRADPVGRALVPAIVVFQESFGPDPYWQKDNVPTGKASVILIVLVNCAGESFHALGDRIRVSK